MSIKPYERLTSEMLGNGRYLTLYSAITSDVRSGNGARMPLLTFVVPFHSTIGMCPTNGSSKGPGNELRYLRLASCSVCVRACGGSTEETVMHCATCVGSITRIDSSIMAPTHMCF
jgi:hypothetical protein